MTVMYEYFSQFLHFGDQWCSKIFSTVHNQFWQDVLKDWQTLIKEQQPQNDCELLRNCIWYNSHVSKNMIFFPDWYKKGIYFVDDIINSDDKLINMRDLNKKYNINVNILNYYTMKAKLALFMSKF